MKYLLTLMLLLSANSLIYAEVINISGSWSGSWRFPDDSYIEKMDFIIHQENSNISGTAIDEKNVNASIEGTLIDNFLTIILTPNKAIEPIEFVGTLENQHISGNWFVSGISGPWSITKNSITKP